MQIEAPFDGLKWGDNWDNVWVSKFRTSIVCVISHSLESIWVIKPSFCQNDPSMGETFWQKDSLITHILSELWLITHTILVRNLLTHMLQTNKIIIVLRPRKCYQQSATELFTLQDSSAVQWFFFFASHLLALHPIIYGIFSKKTLHQLE